MNIEVIMDKIKEYGEIREAYCTAIECESDYMDEIITEAETQSAALLIEIRKMLENNV